MGNKVQRPVVIKVNPDTDRPDLAWDKLKVKQNISVVTDLLPLDTPIYHDKVRFVCLSDTHNQIHRLKCIPDGDVLLHAGDFTGTGLQKEVLAFNSFLVRNITSNISLSVICA